MQERKKTRVTTKSDTPAQQDEFSARKQAQRIALRSLDGRTGGSDMRQDDPSYDEIATRIYQFWQDRGGSPGSLEADWQQAEQELRAEKACARRNTARAAGE